MNSEDVCKYLVWRQREHVGHCRVEGAISQKRGELLNREARVLCRGEGTANWSQLPCDRTEAVCHRHGECFFSR
eukprot:868817-Prorocentrum_minimum.AAC.2